MFPIKDENPQILTPVVTVGLIVLTVVSWIGLQGLGAPSPLAASLCEWGLVPGELLQSVAVGTSVPLGDGLYCVLTATPQPLTLVSHMFLHGGWLHLVGNLWFLWIFGNNVEDATGHARFLVFYLLCGLSAAALQIAADPNSPIPMVGASGAIGGVMGAYIVLYPRVWIHMLLWFGFFFTRVMVPAYFMLGYWIVLQIVGGAVSLGREGGGVAFWAHVGGFAAGMILILVFRNPALVDRHPYHGWRQQRVHRGLWEPEPRRRR